MKIHWKPQPKQEIALLSEADETLFGGGRGGGKTDTGAVWMVEPEYVQHERYRGLVIRRNADDLKDWIDRAQHIYKPLRAEFTGQPTEIHFPWGSKIRTGHLKDESAYTKYQGHEYQKILFEELTHISRENDYEKLLASNRSTIGLRPCSFATTNADGPGFKWVKNRFGIPDYPDFDKTYSSEKGDKKLLFIPSKLEDNQILMTSDPSYAKRLESMSDPEMVAAWRHGSWAGVSVTGAYYGLQIEELKRSGRYTVIPYDEMLPVHTVWDLGVGQNMSIGFYQSVGRFRHMIDYWQGSEKEGLPQAVKILQSKRYMYGKHFGPHDLESTDIGTGKTRIEIAGALGVEFEVLPRLDVQSGIEQGKLFWNRLYVDSHNCSEWIDSIAQYRQGFNEKLGVWTGKPVHDWTSHPADVHRYAALAAEEMTNDVQDPDMVVYWKQQARQAQTKTNRYA